MLKIKDETEKEVIKKNLKFIPLLKQIDEETYELNVKYFKNRDYIRNDGEDNVFESEKSINPMQLIDMEIPFSEKNFLNTDAFTTSSIFIMPNECKYCGDCAEYEKTKNIDAEKKPNCKIRNIFRYPFTPACRYINKEYRKNS